METKKVRLAHNRKAIKQRIKLKGSKSISNRVLIIKALLGGKFDVGNLSESADTHTLLKLLDQTDKTYDAGLAGTTFRFMTAYLALKPGQQILTGSERMQRRPIGPLVKSLNALGCHIMYQNKKSYPPLIINAPDKETGGETNIRGDVSSQFLSALLLIAPYTTKGITLNITSDLVSKPYLEMTIKLMELFGANVEYTDKRISVAPGKYVDRDFYVEGDWSSASYLYEIAALSEDAELTIEGLMEDSFQGDSKIATYAEKFGLQTRYDDKTIHVTKMPDFKKADTLEFNLIEEPDLCQTLVCMCAGLGYEAVFSGLKTLRIKETDRIKALRLELEKMNIHFGALPKKFSQKSDKEYFMLTGQVKSDPEMISIKTYHDHRMAMAFAPLAMIRPLLIQDPEVVVKSYPDFWNDLMKLGFESLGKN